MIKKYALSLLVMFSTLMARADNDVDSALLKLGYYAVPITKLISGHICIQAKLNGVEGLFILDTGANGTVLDNDRKKKFLIESKDSVIAYGAGSGNMSVHSSNENTLDVDGHSFNHILVGVMDLSSVNEALSLMGIKGIDGIIGITSLYQMNAFIDCHGLKMYYKAEKD